MLCGTLLWYRCEGGRPDPDLGPDPRLNPQTGYRIFLKLKCKKHGRIHSKVARIRFFLLKISCLNFSKAVECDANPDPDPWVRIRQKIHQNRKMQMIPDPDVVRICESYQTKGECLRIRILESGFGNFYADPRFASDPYRTVRIPSSGSNRATFSCVCKGIRHLDHP